MTEMELSIIRNCPKCNEMRRLTRCGREKVHVCATCGTPLVVVQEATTRITIPFAFGGPTKITLVNLSPQSGEPPDNSEEE